MKTDLVNTWMHELHIYFCFSELQQIDNNPAQYLSVNPHLLVDDFFDAWIKKKK